MDVEKVLEGLSPEERLELLERLIKEAAEQRTEDLSTEERVARLEEIMLGRRWGFGPWWAPWRARGAICVCPCC